MHGMTCLCGQAPAEREIMRHSGFFKWLGCKPWLKYYDCPQTSFQGMLCAKLTTHDSGMHDYTFSLVSFFKSCKQQMETAIVSFKDSLVSDLFSVIWRLLQVLEQCRRSRIIHHLDDTDFVLGSRQSNVHFQIKISS